ncbi:MAG TPA: ligase-associated DNA damage response exonuclease [Patescibacteria group bacterium]|nr:ligase-associated DNA damage response exonuclease [Patescibacteria group bacterium]
MQLLRHDLYIEPLRAYIDPPEPVDRALITHAHGDHARGGHGSVLATAETIGLMKLRYGEDAAKNWQVVAYGEPARMDGVTVTFYPAGHILGSAQILLETPQKRIVVSGDYKRVPDPKIPAFTPVPCDIFVTEATFGLPVFQHPDPLSEAKKLIRSIGAFPNQSHLIAVYALGKAQRLIGLLRQAGYDAPIYLHGAMVNMCNFYQSMGIDLGELRKATDMPKGSLAGCLVLAPPSALKEVWSRRLTEPITGMASGWMTVKQRVKQKGVELPLVISDHADWNELTQTIADTGAPEVWVTHGREDGLVYWCQQNGIKAAPLHLQGREDEEGETA